jgi:hypothetical protein
MGPKKKEEEEDGELKAPDGCVPLSLTGATQEMFGVKAKVDVTESSPFKPISKDAILKDIQFRGAISCFQPLKAKIEKSALKEIVVFYDAEFSYGESYVVILTDGGREAMQKAFDDLHPQAAAGTAAPSVEGVEGAPSDVPALEAMEVVGEYHGLADARPWESLGSEAEITETTVTPNRELLVVSISRKRREFGLNNFKFADTEIEYNEYRQFREGAYELRRMQAHAPHMPPSPAPLPLCPAAPLPLCPSAPLPLCPSAPLHTHAWRTTATAPLPSAHARMENDSNDALAHAHARLTHRLRCGSARRFGMRAKHARRRYRGPSTHGGAIACLSCAAITQVCVHESWLSAP